MSSSEPPATPVGDGREVGDPQADTTGWVAAHLPDLRRFLACHRAAAADLDDLTQEAAARLLRALDGCRGTARPTSFAFAVTLNVLREHQRRRRSAQALLAGAWDAQVPNRPGHAAEDAAAGPQDEAVRAAVAGLPPRLRRAVQLRYFDGMTCGRVPGAIGCSRRDVHRRLDAAHGVLRLLLAGGDAAPGEKNPRRTSHSGREDH